MVLKKGTAFFEDFFKKIQEGIHDISNREAHQKGCGQRIQIVSCLGNAAADIWQIADDLFKQNQCGKQNKRIDTDLCEQLILLISAASEIIKPSHTDTSNQ